jgi:hypothetical protein
MAEVLKLLADLSQMGVYLKVQVLNHHFDSYDVFSSKELKESFNSFHMKELESSDYRSAYHQFQDWLYGWNVNDAGEIVVLINERMLTHSRRKFLETLT